RDPHSRVDAARGNEARFQGIGEAAFPMGALVRGFGRGEGASHALAHIRGGLLLALGVLLEQCLATDVLLGQGLGDSGDGFAHDAWGATEPVIIYSKRPGWRGFFGRSSMRLIRQAL